MNNKCVECGGDVRIVELDRYDAENELKSMGVVLVNAVRRHECQSCGASKVVIPDLPGLLAAVALYRVTAPWKLQGHEIKFLRKVLEISAKEFADLLEVSQETVSRWENGKAPIGPANEKLLRLMTAHGLQKNAPGVAWDPAELSRMKVSSVRDAKSRQTMTLYYTEMLRDNKAKDVEGV